MVVGKEEIKYLQNVWTPNRSLVVSPPKLNEIGLVAWTHSCNEAEIFNPYLFKQPLLDINSPETQLTYTQKVVQSIAMLQLFQEYTNIPEDLIFSEFEEQIEHEGLENVIDSINQAPHSRIQQHFHISEGINGYLPTCAVFDFANEKTKIFGYFERIKDIGVLDKVFQQYDRCDVILPFSSMPAFPFYNVSEIVVQTSQKDTSLIFEKDKTSQQDTDMVFYQHISLFE